jgi:hypothetical protein
MGWTWGDDVINKAVDTVFLPEETVYEYLRILADARAYPPIDNVSFFSAERFKVDGEDYVGHPFAAFDGFFPLVTELHEIAQKIRKLEANSAARDHVEWLTARFREIMTSFLSQSPSDFNEFRGYELARYHTKLELERATLINELNSVALKIEELKDPKFLEPHLERRL